MAFLSTHAGLGTAEASYQDMNNEPDMKISAPIEF